MDNLSLGPAKPKAGKKNSGISPNRAGGKSGTSGKAGSKTKKSSK
jgi:hypothetical protein